VLAIIVEELFCSFPVNCYCQIHDYPRFFAHSRFAILWPFVRGKIRQYQLRR
jgi:hypothetical protein